MNENMNSKEENLDIRIKSLETQLAFFLEQEESKKRNFSKIARSAFKSVFSRANLELFLSLLALAISVGTAYIVLYG